MPTDEASHAAGPPDSLRGFPLPESGAAVVAVPAPGRGPGYWAGASSAALDEDGAFVVGYRVRNGHDGTDETVIARSEDGERFTTVATLDESEFGAKGMERPALVRTESGRWRLYVCCADPGSPHWWIDALEADEPEGFAAEGARTVFPSDRITGVKDPVVQRTSQGWQTWICCHLLDQPGEEDRMNTAYATSQDGWRWGGSASPSKDAVEPGTPAAPASPPCCPTVAPPTTAEPPPKRTGSNARVSHTRAASPDGCATPTSSPWTSVTSMSCLSRKAAFASTTKPGSPTRATNCARNSSYPRTGLRRTARPHSCEEYGILWPGLIGDYPRASPVASAASPPIPGSMWL